MKEEQFEKDFCIYFGHSSKEEALLKLIATIGHFGVKFGASNKDPKGAVDFYFNTLGEFIKNKKNKITNAAIKEAKIKEMMK